MKLSLNSLLGFKAFSLVLKLGRKRFPVKVSAYIGRERERERERDRCLCVYICIYV